MDTRFSINSKGSSLVLVLISLIIVAIAATSVGSAIANKSRNLKSLSDKVSANLLEIQLNASLTSKNFCGCLLGSTQIDILNMSWLGAIKSIPKGYQDPNVDAPTPCTPVSSYLVPPRGQALPDSPVMIQDIKLGGITQLSPTAFEGLLLVEFEYSNLIRALKNLSIPVVLYIDSGTGKIKSCESGISYHSRTTTNVTGSKTNIGLTGPSNLPEKTEDAQNLKCPAGTVATGLIVKTTDDAMDSNLNPNALIHSFALKCSDAKLKFLPESYIGCKDQKRLASVGVKLGCGQ